MALSQPKGNRNNVFKYIATCYQNNLIYFL